jgi:hypothetical protein
MRAIIGLMLLTATTSHVSDPKKAAALELVKAQLKDSGSAQFKDVKRMGDKGGYCGWVNAKNSYGGYTGFAVFYVNSEGKVAIITPELSEPGLCP